MERFQNKIAVVTGASSGIGAACAKLLLEKGMVVVGLDRRFERMENDVKSKLPANLKDRFHPIKCDVTQEEDIVNAFSMIEFKFGEIHVLINNAGVYHHTLITDSNNTDRLKEILHVNVLGVALCTREAFLSMKKHGVAGHVIMANSLAGHIPINLPDRSTNMYGPSKYAITAMTEVLRHEFLLNETKVKVTSISPGVVDTDMYDKTQFPDGVPMLTAEDVADAIVYCIQTPPHVQIHELIMKPVGAPA